MDKSKRTDCALTCWKYSSAMRCAHFSHRARGLAGLDTSAHLIAIRSTCLLFSGELGHISDRLIIPPLYRSNINLTKHTDSRTQRWYAIVASKTLLQRTGWWLDKNEKICKLASNCGSSWNDRFWLFMVIFFLMISIHLNVHSSSQ